MKRMPILKRRSTYTLLSLLALSAAGSVARAGDLYVLSVGINTYASVDGTLPDLEYAVNDALELERVLRSQGGGLYQKVHPFVFTDKTATRTQIMQAMGQIQARATADDTIIALFSGSGFVTANKFQFPLYGFDPRRATETSLSVNDFQKFYDGSAARTLFLIDSCDAGSLVRDLAQPRSDTPNSFRIAFGAADIAQNAYERPELKHGLFTYAVLEALQGKFERSALEQAALPLPASTGPLELTTFVAYVTERVPGLGRQYDSEQQQIPKTSTVRRSFPLVQLGKR